VDLIANRSTLTVTVTGRSIEVPIDAQERGHVTVSIAVLFKLNRVTATSQDSLLRIRVTEGKFHIRGASIKDPEIQLRSAVHRVIRIPKDATPLDIVALPMAFSLDEIEDSGLLGKVLNAQRAMGEALDSACNALRVYGFERNELGAIAGQKVKAHADAIKKAFPVRKVG
jgi:hypothetical protein